MILVVANKTLDIQADQSKSFIAEKVILEGSTEPSTLPH